MKTKISLAGLLFVAVVYLVAAPSATAYTTSDQKATRLTPTTGLYTITYSFGLPKNDIYLPIKTERGLTHGKSNATLGYTVRTDTGEIVTTGDTAAIVFSNAKVVDGMYFVPAGTAATFTFTAFFRTDSQTEDDAFHVQVENLPFPTKIDSGMQNRSLNPSELQYYVTPNVALDQK